MTPSQETRRSGQNDRGSISVFFVVAAFALLLAVGLVVDGGGKIRALQRADAVAAEAARAGAQAVAEAPALRGESAQLQPGAARSAAQAYLAAAGVPGTVRITGGSRLEVDTTTRYQPLFLSMIGIGPVSTNGYAEARLVRGLDVEQ